MSSLFFFYNTAVPPELYTLSLHDALPISTVGRKTSRVASAIFNPSPSFPTTAEAGTRQSLNSSVDRKSTRLNSSHVSISYAVFCLKKKKNTSFLLHHSRSVEQQPTRLRLC